jgi:hypothetical protein
MLATVLIENNPEQGKTCDSTLWRCARAGKAAELDASFDGNRFDETDRSHGSQKSRKSEKWTSRGVRRAGL